MSAVFTPLEDKMLGTLVGSGLSPAAIGIRLGYQRSVIENRMKALGLQRAARQAKTQRPCMCCGTPFESAGPHNRLCYRCRTKESSPFET
jgi:hypothetical protein